MLSLKVYQQDGLRLPKGDQPGFGNVVFLLAPNKEDGYKMLNDKFIDFRISMYKYFMQDFVYKEKLGYRKYVKNNTGQFRKEFVDLDTDAPIRLVTNGNRQAILKKRYNLIVSLGEWERLFFNFQIKASLDKITTDYWNFIGKRINDPCFDVPSSNKNKGDYNKILLINVDQWLSENNKLSLRRKDLNNPIAILLVTLYKFPQKLGVLHNTDIVFTSPSQNKVMVVKSSDLIKKKYTLVKNRLRGIIKNIAVDEEGVDETVVLDAPSTPKDLMTKPIDQMTTEEIIAKREKKEEMVANQVRQEVLGKITKNLLGDIEDITDDGSYTGDIEVDNDKINEIKNIANNFMDENPEILENFDTDMAMKEVENAIKKRYYIKEYTPKYSDKKLKKIQELAGKQTEVVGSIDEDIKDLESKIIDTSDYSNVVNTLNPNITTSRFVNFDKSYNEKKLEQDIDNAVAQLSNASIKVFVTEKSVEDTSTAMDLKKTYTYKLVDENGVKMTLKFDVPVIFDDHYMMIKGSKKIIQHTLILKPLVKSGKSQVQINSNYQKMFIMLHSSADPRSNALLKFLTANASDFDVVTGNGIVTNKHYHSTLEYNDIARKIVQFRIDDILFILDTSYIDKMIEQGKLKVDKAKLEDHIIIGIDNKHNPIYMSVDDSYVDTVLSYMHEEYREEIKQIARKQSGTGKLYRYATTKPMQKEIPVVLMLLYFEGFTKVMEKAGVEYEIIEGKDDPIDADAFEYGLTEMEDGYIKWKRMPIENSFLMNGLFHLPMNQYSIKELDSKDIYAYMLTNFYSYANQSFNLDQYYDFMIDPITKEILTDMNLPTDLVSLVLLAVKMLASTDYTPEGDLHNMRLRSNEIIPYHIYKAVTSAYGAYRKTQHRRKPQNISVRQDEVIRSMNNQTASAMNDASTLNPILEISKITAVTYKGEGGTNEEHAFKLDVRKYNDSMLGVLGITTSPDSKVGINRQLTLEPNITSTRGYIDCAGSEHVEELNSAQLCTPSEMLTPLGVQHDDPARTSMAFKQTMYMVLPDHADSVLIGNGVEKVLPYHLSSSFSVIAEDAGKVVEVGDDYIVVQYKNGRYRTIDMSVKIDKNATAGFFVESKMISNLKEGDSFKKNEILAWNNKAMACDKATKDVTFRLGPLLKIAVIPEWDIYEDSAPVSKRASEMLATDMVMDARVVLNKSAYIQKIVKVGDKVNAGDTLVVYDNYHDDPDVMALIQSMRDINQEEVIEQHSNKVTTHYTGTIVAIEVITTVPVEELSPTLQKVVKDYWKSIKKKNAVLEKYKNEGDLNYYKSGNVITKAPEVAEMDSRGKVGKFTIGEGIMITFYIEFKDILAKGDKLTSEFALKSITSHVIDEGLEPYAQSRPDESIDLIVAPLSISARKTPSIFLAMFTNKILIEAKRTLKDYWENN